MKKLLALLLLLFPLTTFAQMTVPAGGTGLTSVPHFQVVVGNTSLHLTSMATSSLGLPTFGGTNSWTGVNTFVAGWAINATSTGTSGINISGGCFAINGTCIGAAGGSGTVTSVATTYPVTGGPITTTGTIALAFGTTTANTWSLLNAFTNATSTLLTSTTAWIGTLNLTNALTVANGGTGAQTLTGCLTGNGTGAITGSGTCNTSAASVTSITGGMGLTGGTITTAGILNLKSYLATSTAETANQVAVFTSTGATPATFGSFAGLTFVSATNLLTATNASTTNFSISNNRTTGERYPVWNMSTTTTWAGTTTQNTLTAPFSGTLVSARCSTATTTPDTSADTLNVQFFIGGVAVVPSIVASTTVGSTAFTSANTFTTGQVIQARFGSPVSSPLNISCTGLATGA